MVDTITSIARQLVADKGYLPAAEASLPTDAALPAVPFLGVREYWGSIMTIGLLDADRLTPSQIQQHATAFYAFTHGLLPLAGRLRIGLATTRLGSFGLLAFVFAGGCPPHKLEAVLSARHGSAFRKDYSVSWAIDVPAQRVHSHRGLPLTMFPGARYLKRLLVAT